MNDIEKAVKLLKAINHNMKVDHMMKDVWDGVTEEETREHIEGFGLINLAISVLEKQISIKEVINQLRENKINCKNSSTIYDTKDYILLDKAIEIVKGDWSVKE